MTKTKEWAESLEINTEIILPPSEDDSTVYCRTAGETAARAVIIHAVVAAGSGVNREKLTAWLQDQELWEYASSREQTLLLSPRVFREDRTGVQWFLESETTLLWALNKVKSLGLPVKTCSSFQIAEEIMPPLGEDMSEFISTAEFRPASEFNAEYDRVTKLYYHAQQAVDNNELPEDLIHAVLYHRFYTFRWLTGNDEWDNVSLDMDDNNP